MIWRPGRRVLLTVAVASTGERMAATSRTAPVPIPQEEIQRRGEICVECPYFFGTPHPKCQHLGCPVCPGRQRGEPWRIVPRCPAGRWERKTPPRGGV